MTKNEETTYEKENIAPKVSVILTSFNHEKYIRDAIDSVLNQSFTDFELIIVDDGSADSSWHLINQYSDPRIRAYRNEVNVGGVVGVNRAISEWARSEYIAIHHSDDVWQLDKLEKQVAFLDAHADIGAVFSDAFPIAEDGSPFPDEKHFYFDIFSQPNRTRHEWLRFFFNHGNALCHPSVLIRKAVYEECGLYRNGLTQSADFNMWIRLCMKYEIHVMQEKLVRFRVRDNEANASGSRPDSRIRGVYEFYKNICLYLDIRDRGELFKTFPSMEKYDRGDETDVEFVLAMVAFEGNTFCTKQLFGIDILYRIISDPVRSEKIKALYGFGLKEFNALTGKYDLFSREELSGLRQQLQSQTEQNASLIQVILEKEGVIRQLAGEMVRLANETGALTAESESQQSEIQWQKGSAPQKSAFVAAHHKRFDGLASDIAQVEQLLGNLNEAQIYLHSLRLDLAETAKKLDASEATLSALRRTKVFRLRDVLLHHPWGIRKILHIAYLVVALLTPRFLRTAAAPLTIRLRQMAATRTFHHAEPDAVAESGPAGELDPVAQSELAGEYGDSTYVVRKSKVARTDAPKIAHVIANFMTGGSSRLVVDLIECLGSEYRHCVITSFIPTPPAYVGLEIEECRAPENELAFVGYFQRVQVDFVHVHYWGDSDEPWYAKAILAAEHLGLPLIENVNTPIAPYLSEAVARYVYVSDYARRVFGKCDPRHISIYPGSDFSRFIRGSDEALPENCVGMVYRLERDKLDERSIEPFIRIVQRRPQTRILIVGGGSLLEPFQEAVRLAGASGSFEFTGYVGYEELPGLYRRMTVFVAPVWKESFGQVSPFAMNMRVPVVGYGVGAIGEIVEAPELLAPPGDAEKLADIAIELLDNPDQRAQIGEMQRDRAEANFSLQAMIRGYAKIYAEMSLTCSGRASSRIDFASSVVAEKKELVVGDCLSATANQLCSIVIPTKNGGALFVRVLEKLQRQNLWDSVELLVVDSGSTDGTIEAARRAGARVLEIPPEEFNHGATRDYGISNARGEIVVLMVQDAVPNDSNLLDTILQRFSDPEVAGVYVRQIPQPDADLLTKRNLNNWLTGRVESETRKMKTRYWFASLTPIEKYFFCNFDNVCSAVRKSVWQSHKFGHVNFGEDIDWAERILKAGFKIVYEPLAAVIHSHDRPVSYEYKRTYACHRKLYRQFGLQLIPSLWGILRSWVFGTGRDVKYVSHGDVPISVKLGLLAKIPLLNLLNAVAQYRGARDEAAGTTRHVRGV